MGERPSKLGRFWAELRRRHVVRVAVGYGMAAFVVLQLGEIILPAFSAEWALQFLVVFATLGFPVVVVLAWVFDITPQGIRMTDRVDAESGRASDIPSAGMLPRVALLAVTLITVGGLGWWWIENGVQLSGPGVSGSSRSSFLVAYDPDESIRSLAVLPFENFSESDEQDYFAAGMHEALVARLSQLPAIRVISRTSVARYAGTTKSMPEIARELGVDGIVEGSVLRAGDEVRITVQLIHGPSDTHVWAKSYERTFSSVLALQAEVAEAIAEEIQGELTPEEQATLMSFAPSSEVPEANEEFMKARYEQGRETLDGLRAAMGHYAEALEADSTFAQAYAGLAGLQIMLEMAEPSDPAASIPAASIQRARVIALKALQFNPELAEAHDVLTLIDTHLGEERVAPGGPLQAPRISTELRFGSRGTVVAMGSEGAVKVITLDSTVMAMAFRDFKMDSMRVFESITEVGRQLQAAWAGWSMRRAGGASVAPTRMVHAAQQLHAAGHTVEAIELLVAVCEQSPEHAEAWETLESLYASEGSYAEIVELRKDWVAHAGGDEESVERLENRLLRDGPEGYWDWRLEELNERSGQGEWVSPVHLAAAHAAMGENDEALRFLQVAFRSGDRRLASVRADPVWDPLRSDPRFVSLMRRIRSAAVRRPRRPGD